MPSPCRRSPVELPTTLASQPDSWETAMDAFSPDMTTPFISTQQDSILDTPLFDPDTPLLSPILPEWWSIADNFREPVAQPFVSEFGLGYHVNSLLPPELHAETFSPMSAASRKEVPATFRRKHARSTTIGSELDDNHVLPANPTEDLIEHKRRQSTVAARRSRQRKLKHLQLMEKSLKNFSADS